jgi:predicted transcriptional regulator
MVIRDREELSLKNAEHFTDKDGYLFQYFDQEKAGELLGLSKNAIVKAFKDLQEYKLIESVRQGQGKPNRLYVLDYEVSEDTLKELSYENKKASTGGTVKATNTNKNNIDTNIIPQNNKKYSPKNKENKNNTSKGASANVNNTFMKYEADELEKLLQEQQSKKFKPNYPINN